MAAPFKYYSSYKDVEIDWLESIPKEWSFAPIKYQYSVVGGSTPKSGEVTFWDGDVVWVTPADLSKLSTKYVNVSLRSITKEGLGSCGASLVPERSVIVSTRAPIGSLAIAAFSLCTNQGCKALVPLSNRDDSRYLYYWLLVNSEPLNVLGKGTTFLEISGEVLAGFDMPVPPQGEQEQIANFLDHETAKIDTLIDKQQQLIKLLKEKRQAVISHAVTKGLNPDATMKDSGVEWLGKVPEHWKVLSLGKITEDKCDGPFGSGLKSEHYTESGVLVVRLQNIKSGVYHEGEGAFIDENYYKYYLSNHDVVAGDVLIAGLGDPNNPVGRACVAPENIGPAMVKADCFRFRLNRKKVIPNFVARQLSVSAPVDAGRLSNGSTRARIPLNLMATRKVAICPLVEQGHILEHIDALSEQYDRLEEAASKAVSLLQERRTALISAAVTGKIDVRNWQPAG